MLVHLNLTKCAYQRSIISISSQRVENSPDTSKIGFGQIHSQLSRLEVKEKHRYERQLASIAHLNYRLSSIQELLVVRPLASTFRSSKLSKLRSFRTVVGTIHQRHFVCDLPIGILRVEIEQRNHGEALAE